MRLHLLLLAALGVLAPGRAGAHDLWLERAGETLVLRYGHRGGELLALARSKLKAARCHGPGAARDLLGAAVFAPTQVALDGRCAVATASLDGGFFSLTPDGEVNLPKSKVPDAVKAWASRQFAKWVEAGAKGIDAVAGDELELVPVSDLAKAREGDRVTVRLLSLGKPVRDAVVAIGHKALGETDSAGEARVRLRTSGVEVISATLRRKVATPEADAEVLEASLSFQVAR